MEVSRPLYICLKVILVLKAYTQSILYIIQQKTIGRCRGFRTTIRCFIIPRCEAIRLDYFLLYYIERKQCLTAPAIEIHLATLIKFNSTRWGTVCNVCLRCPLQQYIQQSNSLLPLLLSTNLTIFPRQYSMPFPAEEELQMLRLNISDGTLISMIGELGKHSFLLEPWMCIQASRVYQS